MGTRRPIGDAIAMRPTSNLLRRSLPVAAGAAALALAAAPAAEARPCSDRVPVVVDGTPWIVYTGDSARELRDIPCSEARTIARRMIARGEKTAGWSCSAKRARCARGGRVTDRYGNRQWRYLVGWHRAD